MGMNTDLTVGRTGKVLFYFTLPLFISVIFQQLYNMADSAVVGIFLGEEALAGVGTSYSVTMLFMAVALGSNIGVTVILSKLFGAAKYADLKTAASTAILSCTVLGIFLSVLGILMTEQILRLINTPDNIFADAAIYLKIYTAGFLFLYLYNIGNGVFTALGDSKTPLYFLICSSLGNIVLDIFFVHFLSWGVAGVAWATFIAQGLAGLLSLALVLHRLRSLPHDGRTVLFSFTMFKKLAIISALSIISQSCISAGNILIQRLINSYGSPIVAGFSAALKLNTFVVTCLGTVGSGLSAFTAQNMGASRVDRVKEAVRLSLYLGILGAGGFSLLFFFGAKFLLDPFLDPVGTAMEAGTDFLRIVGPGYPIILSKFICDGILRGAGSMKEYTIATFADLLLRVFLSYLFSYLWGHRGIWLSWPTGWCLGAILSYVFYKKGHWQSWSGKI